MAEKPTYAELFRFLKGLGFVDVPTNQPDRAFRHAETDTLLVFSWMHAEQDKVANADLVSAERFLQEKRLLTKPLSIVLQLTAADPKA